MTDPTPAEALKVEDEAVIDVATRLLLAEINPAHAEQVRRGIRTIEESTIDGAAVMRAICNALAFAPPAALPRPPAADAGEVRERPAKLTMPNGDVLECEYPNGTDWAKSWSIRYPTTGTIGTTGEQDWEIVETYGLTAIANAILALPQAPSPTFEDGTYIHP